MKYFDRLINLFTYLLTICFVLTIQIGAFLGCKVILTLLPTYFPEMSTNSNTFTTIIVWGGVIFAMLIVTRIGHPLYKKYIYIKTK